MTQNDQSSLQHQLNELLTALEDSDPDSRWLHVRTHDSSILSCAPKEWAIEAARRASARSSPALEL